MPTKSLCRYPPKEFCTEYKPLVVKKVTKNFTVEITKTNYDILCDVETLLGLAYVLPLLELV